MNNLKKKLKIGRRWPGFALVSFFLVLLSISVSCWASETSEKLVFEIEETFYNQVLEEYQEKGYEPTKGVNIIIPATDYITRGGGEFGVAQGIGGFESESLLWSEENSWLEWQVDIPASGLYNIALKYYPVTGKGASLHRDLKIDGEYPFSEAKRLSFTRFWKDKNKPEQDNRGNDIRPRQIEAPQWKYQLLEDIKGMYREPFLFYLSKGRHYLRMRDIREPMALSFINVLSPAYLPTYKEKITEWRLKGHTETKGVFVKIQAEDAYLKSDPTVRGELGDDPLTEPPAQGQFRLNSFGSWRWRIGNQWARWKFSAPESGLYVISFKGWQGWSSHMPSVRSLKIDGKYPFREMEEILFRYDRHSRIDTLSDEEGQPYLFYLAGGEHILELKVKVGPVREIVLSIQGVMKKITQLYREVILITGVQPDPNAEWYNLPYLVPELCPRLEEIARSLDEDAKFLTQLVGYRPSSANTLLVVSEQMKSIAKKPHTIPKRLKEISSTLSSLGYWALELQEGPLSLDYFLVSSAEVEMPRARSKFLEKFVLGWQNFVASFHKKYTAIGSVYRVAAEEKIIEVWVARGREWVDITKEMIEDDFTPTTGIKVNVNIFPAAQMQALLLAMAAGEAPDVACGVEAGLPVEFAIRNGVLNLNEFSDYSSVSERFRPGALVPFHYKEGDYALPENQDFNMLFYRTDILEELKIEPPQTWNDLYKILPILAQNGLEFYYGGVAGPQASAGLTPFLFQKEGTYYTSDGLKSALDSSEALAAFREWTGLYTKYKIPIRANFFNRMRSGEMPIGIADYWNYVLLSTAAPELTGRWRMVPIPGTEKPDGTIDRSAGGVSQVVIIPSRAKHKKQAWEFVKWWTSTKVQARFGREIEALLGVEARWNTANVEALKMLSWPKDDIKNILEQWKWFKEVPTVPGGYFTPRHVSFAWNRVVVSGLNARESLEEAVKEINRELLRKAEEFRLVGKEKIRELEREYDGQRE